MGLEPHSESPEKLRPTVTDGAESGAFAVEIAPDLAEWVRV